MRAYPIWQMKYCTKSVLIDTSKVGYGKCYIYFVADRNYLDLYSVDGTKVRDKCDIIFNGKIYCFDVPLEWLVNEGELPKELEEQRQVQYEKFKEYVAKNKSSKK